MIKYLNYLDSVYLSKGYIVAEDLKISMWAAKAILWVGHRLGEFERMSTVVDGNRVICFHDKSTLLGHGHYPNAHIETRYTLDKKFFRQKIWSE